MTLQRRLLLMTPILALAFGSAQAASVESVQVHVRECTCVDGTVTELADTVRATGGTYLTQKAPEIAGYVFTGWTISTAQDFSPRDRRGRAYDAVPYTVFEATTLTANYMADTVDDDGDGVPDGYELYWYGNLSVGANADTDGDGYTLAEEIAAGTNPLLRDTTINGGVVWSDGNETWYNPNGYQPVIVKSEPEGALFETELTYLAPGSEFTSPVCDRQTTAFAYWTLNGARQTDRRGRALDRVKLTVGGEAITLVAVTVEDESLRDQLYWYGHAVSPDSDTDGDGYTFAEEIAAGTNPLFPDTTINGGVVWGDGEELVYHSSRAHACTIRSEPEGELFETEEAWHVEGERIVSPRMDAADSAFAYWTLNGVRQADRNGRARDVLSFDMPAGDVELVAVAAQDELTRAQLYWYGRAVAADSDTDGDGYTFAQEIAAGTNPLLKDTSINGGVVWGDSTPLEVDLQPFEQGSGTLVDGAYVTLFASSAGAGRDFGGAIVPTVVDLNGDGMFDFVVEREDGEKFVFLHVGSKSVPAFVTATWNAAWGALLEAAKVRSVDGLSFDVPPADALSYSFIDADSDGRPDLLMSDAVGRIWYYRSTGGNSYALQHKVWGGTHVGFAEGLMISAVDWDDDGDADCLCGTADGRLMLLSDPRAGRPTNLRAQTGVDDVVLDWNANNESRIRGYNVYRAEADTEGWRLLQTASLPTCRDAPNVLRPYDYLVTAVSRFYTAGNSAPVMTESVPAGPVRVEFGKVRFTWRPASGFIGETVAVGFSVENAQGLSADNLRLQVEYDPDVLTPVEVKKSGLTERLAFDGSWADGSWRIVSRGGTIEAGSGTFLTFVFRISDWAAFPSTVVSISDFGIGSTGGSEVEPVVEVPDIEIGIDPDIPADPSHVPPGSRGDLDGDGRLGWNDIELFLRWKDADPDTIPQEIVEAADYNGDGKLNNRDYHLMKVDFRERERSGGDMAGWNRDHNLNARRAK